MDLGGGSKFGSGTLRRTTRGMRGIFGAQQKTCGCFSIEQDPAARALERQHPDNRNRQAEPDYSSNPLHMG